MCSCSEGTQFTGLNLNQIDGFPVDPTNFGQWRIIPWWYHLNFSSSTISLSTVVTQKTWSGIPFCGCAAWGTEVFILTIPMDWKFPYINIKLEIIHPWKVSTLSKTKTGLTQHCSPFWTTESKYDGKHRDNSRILRIRFWISVLQVVLPGKTTFNRLVSNTQANYFIAHLQTI